MSSPKWVELEVPSSLSNGPLATQTTPQLRRDSAAGLGKMSTSRGSRENAAWRRRWNTLGLRSRRPDYMAGNSRFLQQLTMHYRD